MRRLWSIVTITALTATVGAQQTDESPWDPDASGGKAPKPGLTNAKTLADLSKALDEGYRALGDAAEVGDLPAYLEARGKIAAARDNVKGAPSGGRARELFLACSLATEAARAELALRNAQVRLRNAGSDYAETMSELNRVQQEISAIQGDKASRLKSELDEEKRKAAKMRKEADRRFSELHSALIQVSQDARGTIISMSDILFETGKANLTPDLKTSLAKIAGILLVFKTSNVIVEGHTDNVGTEEYNQRLSENRAENVMRFLIEQGVSPARLTAVGYAFHRPIAPNTTREGRAKNRRVDLIVQEKPAAE